MYHPYLTVPVSYLKKETHHKISSRKNLNPSTATDKFTGHWIIPDMFLQQLEECPDEGCLANAGFPVQHESILGY
jgi:hypothetical protein